MIKEVVKRDGTVVPFEKNKITMAIYKAMLSVKNGTMKDAEQLADRVVARLKDKERPSVEEIQDVVEDVLMTSKIDGKTFTDVAKSYILYREKRRAIREEKELMGVKDDLKLTLNAVKVLEARYLLKDEDGKIIETPRQMFRRVATHIGIVEALYDYIKYKKTGKVPENAEIIGKVSPTQEEVLRRAFGYMKEDGLIEGTFEEFMDFIQTKGTSAGHYINKFEEVMSSLDFVPNSPTLMNAGTKLGQLSACFVLPVGDSIEDIFETLKNTALIHKSGGGTGFSFSRLRPKDDIVGSTKGVASGPVSFMKIFDVTTDVIKQGGKRRGANMGILNYNHPDIMEFILSKDSENKVLSNFNISVGVTDDFFDKLDNDDYVDLVNPRTKKIMKRIKAREIWDAIIDQAWKTADPGLIFLDEINRKNPVKNVGDIESTNPCGEQPLLPYESCNLGSINLAKYVVDGKKIDFDRLRETVWTATRFLDDVIDANKFPVEQIKKVTRMTRKIGLGVMGFADMLIKLEIPYNSWEALEIGEKVMSFINDESHKASQALAEERGVFPAWYGSEWEKEGIKMRNSTTTTIAPTGTISIIAGCSSSIEPIFALAFVRHVLNGQELLEVNPLFEEKTRELGIYSEELMRQVAETGNLENVKINDEVKKIFVTAHEIDPQWHVLMQATFQRYCDSGVSKTINMRSDATR
ncbi:MAG: adenosylcobalamin-dependent ribonucleoside-diphosphate reductase, partial [Thermoplasma acidophilum]|nr:adenosylcobalamin-dependent ribonucleoside-diphosphate reductase [Thermoplasma acidophilum]